MVGCGFASNLTYALVGAALRHWLGGPVVDGLPSGRRLRAFNGVMGLALALTALWMLANGLARPPGG